MTTRTAAGPVAETARAVGVRAVVGAPVLVHGRLWGVITTASTRVEPLPRMQSPFSPDSPT